MKNLMILKKLMKSMKYVDKSGELLHREISMMMLILLNS